MQSKLLRHFFLLLAPLVSLAAISERPDDLEKPKEPHCNLWKGTASGNDPTVEVQVTLCTEENGDVTGVLQWSSENSGWSRRALLGKQKIEDKKPIFVLHDEKFIEKKPNPGWRFCLIDEYKLTQTKDTLSGSYVSSACTDQATLSLTLQPKK